MNAYTNPAIPSETRAEAEARIARSRAEYRAEQDAALATIESVDAIDEAYVEHVAEWGEEAMVPSVFLADWYDAELRGDHVEVA